MDKLELDINLIKEYIYKDNFVKPEEKILFISLFNFYKKANKLNSFQSIEDELKKYEDKIYNIDNKTLTEEEKLRLEIEKIKRIRITDPEIKQIVDQTIKKIENLLNDKLYFSNDVIDYIKKKIIELQIFLKLDITFFKAAYDLFKEKYDNLKISEYNKRLK